MRTRVDARRCITTSRSHNMTAEMTPDAVLCPWRCAEAATWLTSLLAPSEDYYSQALQLIYVVADAARVAPTPRAPRVRAFVRYTVTLIETDDLAESSERAQHDLGGRLRSASDWLCGNYSFKQVPANALKEALNAEACGQRLAGLRYARRLPAGVPLAPPHITPMLDYLVGKTACAALEFRVERRSPHATTDEAPLRFGVVALGEAADEAALEPLTAELCGGHSPLLESASGAAPTMTLLRPTTPEQRAWLYAHLTAPADELQPLLDGAPVEDVTLTITEAGGRIAMPQPLF